MAQSITGGKIVWDLELNNKLANQLKTAQTDVNKFSSSLDRSNTSLKNHSSRIDSAVSSLAKLAAGYIGFKVATAFIQNAIDKFNDYEKVVTNLVTVQLNQQGATQSNVKALMDQAEALSLNSLYSKEQILTAQTSMLTFDGMTTELVQKAIPAWMNYTALQYGVIKTNDEARSSAEAFTKTTVGSTEALTKQGFVFTDTQKEILKTGTATERLNVVLEAMAYATDASANLATTFAGRMKILSENFDTAQKSIGLVAQAVQLEILNAFIQGSGNAESYGNNMLTVAKQVGEAFMKTAQVIGNSILQIARALNAVDRFVVKPGLNLGAKGEKAFLESGLGKAILGGEGGFGDKARTERLDEINAEIIKRNAEIQNAADAEKQLAQSIESFNNNINTGIGSIQGITSLDSTIAALKRGANPNAPRNMAQEGAAKQDTEEAKKQADAFAKAKEKVLDFQIKAKEMHEKRSKALENEKTKLNDLKVAYDKSVAAIKKNLQELDAAFKRSEESAKESFLSSLQSAVKTSQDTIKEREQQISDLKALAPTDEINGKIAGLEALNERDKAILAKNGELVKQAEQAEQDSKTALSVQKLIDRYNEERNITKQKYQQDKADLNTQLTELGAEHEKSRLEIQKSTKDAVEDIRVSYLKMFDDLSRELEKLGQKFLSLLTLGAISAPGPSEAALGAYNKLIGTAPKREHGGPVMPNRAYMVGERGPELFMPSQGGNIIPNGGGNTLHIENINLASDMDVDNFIDKVTKKLGIKGLYAEYGASNI